jgi:hypothetical protein
VAARHSPLGFLVVLLTKVQLSAADEKALWVLAVAIPGWVVLWLSLHDMGRYSQGKTPQLILQNFALGLIPGQLGTIYMLYSLMHRLSPWLSVLMFGLDLSQFGGCRVQWNCPSRWKRSRRRKYPRTPGRYNILAPCACAMPLTPDSASGSGKQN